MHRLTEQLKCEDWSDFLSNYVNWMYGKLKFVGKVGCT